VSTEGAQSTHLYADRKIRLSESHVQRGAAESLVNEEAAPEQVHAVTDGHMLMIMLCLWLTIVSGCHHADSIHSNLGGR